MQGTYISRHAHENRAHLGELSLQAKRGVREGVQLNLGPMLKSVQRGQKGGSEPLPPTRIRPSVQSPP